MTKLKNKPRKVSSSSKKTIKLGNKTISFGIVSLLVVAVVGITGLAMVSSRMNASASYYSTIVSNPQKTVTLYACKIRVAGSQWKINSKLVNRSSLYWGSYGGSDLSNGYLSTNVAPGKTSFGSFSPIVSNNAIVNFSIMLTKDVNGYKSGPLNINNIKAC